MQKLMRHARAELRDIKARLRADVEKLKALHTALPVSPQEEAMLEGELETDFATETRAIIECVISDRLEPAIGALAEITEATEARRKKGRRKGAASKRL
jgi:hypothetical protein